MMDMKYLFVGNRGYVLDYMLERNLDTDILAIEASYLAKKLGSDGIEFETISSRSQLKSVIHNAAFDVLVSNGCPFILPVSELCAENQLFVNIHPSPLPDLRGADPVPGAILHGRDSGASCHIMNDEVDAGPIVSRVFIPNNDDLEARLLYQMSFVAEVEAFRIALDRAFTPDPELNRHWKQQDLIYYTTKDRDRILDLRKPPIDVIRTVRAFSNRSQGAVLNIGNISVRVYAANLVLHPFLLQRLNQYQPNEVVFVVENMLILKHHDAFLQLDRIEGDLSSLRPGAVISGEPA